MRSREKAYSIRMYIRTSTHYFHGKQDRFSTMLGSREYLPVGSLLRLFNRGTVQPLQTQNLYFHTRLGLHQ